MGGCWGASSSRAHLDRRESHCVAGLCCQTPGWGLLLPGTGGCGPGLPAPFQKVGVLVSLNLTLTGRHDLFPIISAELGDQAFSSGKSMDVHFHAVLHKTGTHLHSFVCFTGCEV